MWLLSGEPEPESLQRETLGRDAVRWIPACACSTLHSPGLTPPPRTPAGFGHPGTALLASVPSAAGPDCSPRGRGSYLPSFQTHSAPTPEPPGQEAPMGAAWGGGQSGREAEAGGVWRGVQARWNPPGSPQGQQSAGTQRFPPPPPAGGGRPGGLGSDSPAHFVLLCSLVSRPPLRLSPARRVHLCPPWQP